MQIMQIIILHLNSPFNLKKILLNMNIQKKIMKL